MSTTEEKGYIRALHIFIGITLIIMAILVFIFTSEAVITLLIMIAITVLVMGIPRVINGGTNTALEKKIRAMKLITGGLAIMLGVLAIILMFIDPTISIEYVIFILASALIILGIGRFLRGIHAQEYPIWFRTLIIIVGLLTIILSIVVLLFPPADSVLNIVLLSIILLFNGIGRLGVGVVSSK